MSEADAILILIGAGILAISLVTIPLLYLLVFILRRPLRAAKRVLLRRMHEEMEEVEVTVRFSNNGTRISKKE